jgi:hypothetical protein
VQPLVRASLAESQHGGELETVEKRADLPALVAHTCNPSYLGG